MSEKSRIYPVGIAVVAITRGLFVPIPSGFPPDEGWIAVHV